MVGKEDPNPQAKESEEEYLSRLREAVETALQHFGTAERSAWLNVTRFRGKLSTDLGLVDPSVDRESLSYQCYTMSSEIKHYLELLGTRITLHGSASSTGYPEHIFLVPDDIDSDVIVDPSLGQFIDGHNNVFVGKRDDLRQLVGVHLGNEFFEINWGTQSLPLSQFKFSSPGEYYAAWSLELATATSLPPAKPE